LLLYSGKGVFGAEGVEPFDSNGSGVASGVKIGSLGFGFVRLPVALIDCGCPTINYKESEA